MKRKEGRKGEVELERFHAIKGAAWIAVACSMLLSIEAFAGEKHPKLVTRADNIPVDDFEHATDLYLEGYIQSLLDMNYYECHLIVAVRDHKVYLANIPDNPMLANSIKSFVSEVPGVTAVCERDEINEELKAIREKYTEQPHVNGVWFPQATVLFQPLVADPREPMYYVAYRWGDKVMGRTAIAVALGDDFPLFRWCDVFRWHGDMQIGIQAGIWAVFNFSHVPKESDGSCELMNTDYLLGIPLTYAVDQWSFRLKLYHISSHLGDEFLVDHPNFVHERVNPSYEALELINSYQLDTTWRFYGGPGIILHSDETFSMKTFYLKYGTEARPWGKKFCYMRLFGTPFFAVEVENWQVRHWNFDLFVKVGYEFSKMQGIGRKVRFFAEYHHGYSYEGQFFKERTQYGQFGLSWGF